MFKILILAYLMGTNPVETQQTFQMELTFNTMSECKANLLSRNENKTYKVMREFVVDGQFKWDWLAAGCKNDKTGEEFIIKPFYPLGKPKELEGIELDIRELEV
ncbi:MAG TPA: hypothetical protein EYN33_02665 [Gammaproteobacteria bacterium]|nr:hypothetical protein [Gammaproteobacteria bacterium]